MLTKEELQSAVETVIKITRNQKVDKSEFMDLVNILNGPKIREIEEEIFNREVRGLEVSTQIITEVFYEDQ